MFALLSWSISVVLADPVFEVDASYGLAINVGGIPPGTACTITWQRSDGVGPKVSQNFAANAIIRLLRFTPKKEYKFQVTDSAGRTIGSQESYTCTVGKTGVDDYDVDKPYVHFTGHPSFEMLVIDHGKSLVGFNADGWLVWYLPGAIGAWDQLPAEKNYDIVTLMAGEMAHIFGASGMEVMSSSGKSVSSIKFRGLSHEARADRTNSDLVLSLGSEVRKIPGLTRLVKGDTIVQWNRTSGSMDTIYNLFDFYDPVTDYGQCSGLNKSEAAKCFPPIPHPPMLFEEWTHGNSVERGTRDNYIMSARHLSSVISFHADGSGIQWVLSGENVKPSKAPNALVLKYAEDGDRQYNEHCARQLDNGNVIMFDNGDLRQPPFSRFSEYEIDVEKGTANLVWQFVPMLDNATSGQKMFAFHAGSVHRMPNGNTVGALSCDNPRVGKDCSHAVFEADSEGHEVARALVPTSTSGGLHKFGYRATVLATLGGEREVSTVVSEILI